MPSSTFTYVGTPVLFYPQGKTNISGVMRSAGGNGSNSIAGEDMAYAGGGGGGGAVGMFIIPDEDVADCDFMSIYMSSGGGNGACSVQIIGGVNNEQVYALNDGQNSSDSVGGNGGNLSDDMLNWAIETLTGGAGAEGAGDGAGGGGGSSGGVGENGHNASGQGGANAPPGGYPGANGGSQYENGISAAGIGAGGGGGGGSDIGAGGNGGLGSASELVLTWEDVPSEGGSSKAAKFLLLTNRGF